MLFGAAPVHVCGAEPLVSCVIAGLHADGRAARRLAPEQLATLKPGRVSTLILADPPAPADLIVAFAARSRQARSRFRPGSTRLILMHAADPPPALPDLDLDERLRLETFAVENRAARALLRRWPLHLGMDPLFGQRPHLLLAGFASPAHAFLVQALRLIQYGDARPLVTLLSEDPESLAAQIQSAYPQAGQIADLRFGDLAAPRLAGTPPVTLALVALNDPDESGLAVARLLARTIAAVQRASSPILLEIGERKTTGDIADWDGQIIPVSYLQEACRAGVLLDGIGDEVAQTIHEHYCDSIAAQGRDPVSEPAGQPWTRLATSYRQANRHQADHLWAKLAVTDCRAVPEDMVDAFAFAPLEVERLALIEHRRWAADRHLDGWSHAPVRDNARKHHPQLIPYAELSEPMKDLDRFAVRGVPTLLARSGLGVVRLLIVGLSESESVTISAKRLHGLTGQVLTRLLTRYPDRALIIAATLTTPGARQVVRQALERAGAGLFWLLPRPIGELLDAQPEDGARRDLLELGARADRRITLAGEADLARWFTERAEIVFALDGQGAQERAAKAIRPTPDWRRLDWNFEY
ncbi:RyR domain-containing protein [Thiobaca trueperi]|uniref:RyR domain-containing protein n=1 Tax=Thiobaca trueperi TaxID=127458 RepID=A0A4R3MUP2_9GAMM|nr:RyR domain-containing protein [Thiobaca trueperi]TCT20200.1 RyR domain-containing protein [Thiobaca trueperi]